MGSIDSILRALTSPLPIERPQDFFPKEDNESLEEFVADGGSEAGILTDDDW